MGETSNRDDEWQRRATAAARKIVLKDSPIPMNTSIGRLSDLEWGWIVCAILFAWISVRAEQATVEGLDSELTVRMTGLDPDPWDAGAVATILPALADTPGIDWFKSPNDWPRETMIRFLTVALGLIRKASIARDLGGGTITRKSAVTRAREATATAGGPSTWRQHYWYHLYECRYYRENISPDRGPT
jgi:hypothetical protein